MTPSTTLPVLTTDNVPGFARVHALYRHYDDAGTLLYVGVSRDPRGRWADHCVTSPWVTAGFVAWVEVVWFDDRAAAERTERLVIRRDLPLFNKRRRGRHDEAATRMATYLTARAAAGPHHAAAELGTLRRVRCRYVPSTTCVTCGPDAGAWLEQLHQQHLQAVSV